MKKIFLCMFIACTSFMLSCDKKVDVVSCEPIENKSKELAKEPKGPFVLNMIIQLDGKEEVPMVNTKTKGLAHLRLTADKKLYSKVIIQKLAAGDTLRFAHVHAGAKGTNGPVKIFLCHTAADFGKNIETTLTDEQYTFLTTEACYVNAHSNFFPPGIVRGQVR